MLMFELFIAGVVLEILIVTSWVWSYRFWVLGITETVASVAMGLLIGNTFNVATILILVVGAFRIINLLRIAQQRMNEHYLRRVVLRTSIFLILCQLLVFILWKITALLVGGPVPTKVILLVISLLQSTVCVSLVFITSRSLKKTKFTPIPRHLTDHELPTVTEAIPARNESAELEACLDAVIASDYPKLEILVLDDSSQDKTPDVVKSFARSGVRFIHGEAPKTNWLAKNQAYRMLSEAATGEYILFLSVDTLVSPTTIRALITSSLDKNKSMVCVMAIQKVLDQKNVIIQPMRYWWELAMPRRLLNRPAVTSSFWVIKRSVLTKLGGFNAVSRAVIPEAYFARKLVLSDEYAFVRSNGSVELQSAKNQDDQFSRAIRIRYPEIHRRPELAMLVALSEFLLFILPIFLFIYSVFLNDLVTLILSLISILSLLFVQYKISRASVGGYKVWQVIKLPIMAFTEICLGLYSMYCYEFSTVEWKGRNISQPVMHVVPSETAQK